MASVRANGLTLAYEWVGPRENPPVVLIMGFNMTMMAWPEGFCRGLIDAGYSVVRFDNRDVGLSSRLAHLGSPAFATSIRRRLMGLKMAAPYSLDDMARDTLSLMDALEICQAHVIGISMGGMIAQIMAINSPERLLSLGLMMTHSGSLRFLFPSPSLVPIILHQPSSDLDSQIEYGQRFWRALAGPAYPPDPEQLTQAITLAFQQSSAPHGRKRQFAAIMASPNRNRKLASVRVPTSVLHGSADPMISPRGGRRLADAIPDATFDLIHGLGHDLPQPLWQDITNLLIRNFNRA